jgi:hypothetical protein
MMYELSLKHARKLARIVSLIHTDLSQSSISSAKHFTLWSVCHISLLLPASHGEAPHH